MKHVSEIKDNQNRTTTQHLPDNELKAQEVYANETELELHDYVNLQECHEMMNMHQTLFDLKVPEPNQHQQVGDNTSQNNVPPIYQNGIYCNNCKKG